jgi:hypothetical protein
MTFGVPRATVPPRATAPSGDSAQPYRVAALGRAGPAAGIADITAPGMSRWSRSSPICARWTRSRPMGS